MTKPRMTRAEFKKRLAQLPREERRAFVTALMAALLETTPKGRMQWARAALLGVRLTMPDPN